MATTTKVGRILSEFRKAGRRGLTTWELIKIDPAEYRARISDLRNEGYNITPAERVYINGKSTNIFRYYLNEETETADVA